MTTSGNQRKWRNILVHPSFQLRLALIHFTFVLLVVAVVFAVFAIILHYDLYGSGDLWARYATARLMLVLLERMAGIVLLIVVASVVYHVIFSHRLCGPLVNIGYTFDSIAKGDLTRKVFLRRKDFLKEEASRINDMMAALNGKVRELKTNQANLSQLAARLPQGSAEDGIRNIIDRNQMILDKWTVLDEPDSPGSTT